MHITMGKEKKEAGKKVAAQKIAEKDIAYGDRKSVFMNLPSQLLDEIDKYCTYKFTNRTQFIIAAVLEKLEREGYRQPSAWES